MDKVIRLKTEACRSMLRRLERVAVAFSGGIDSTLVLKLAVDELGEGVLGVTACSPSVPGRELAESERLAREIGARHIVIQTAELENPNYASNPSNRCYYCKTELYGQLSRVAKAEGISVLANGTNADDVGDHRPGLQAADEFQVVSPLRDAGMSKADVRVVARELNLNIWDKPASPCLSSRIPYGSPVTREKLKTIEAAENLLRAQGFRELRVRHFGKKARIEVPAGDLERMAILREQIDPQFRQLGFDEVDVQTFRSGILNDVLKQ